MLLLLQMIPYGCMLRERKVDRWTGQNNVPKRWTVRLAFNQSPELWDGRELRHHWIARIQSYAAVRGALRIAGKGNNLKIGSSWLVLWRLWCIQPHPNCLEGYSHRLSKCDNSPRPVNLTAQLPVESEKSLLIKIGRLFLCCLSQCFSNY